MTKNVFLISKRLCLTERKKKRTIKEQSRKDALSVAEWDVVRERKRTGCDVFPRPLRVENLSIVMDLRMGGFFMGKYKKNVSMDTDNKQKNKFSIKHIPVKKICYIAVFVALSVIANTFTVYMNVSGSNALSFTYTVDFLAGALLGPLAGFLTGLLGDLLGWFINSSGGAYNPFLSLTSGLLGLLPGLVFLGYEKIFEKKKKYILFMPLVCVVSFLSVWAVCTNLNTFLMYVYYIAGKSKKYTSFSAYYIYRIPVQTLFWAINMILSACMIVPMKKLLKL